MKSNRFKQNMYLTVQKPVSNKCNITDSIATSNIWPKALVTTWIDEFITVTSHLTSHMNFKKSMTSLLTFTFDLASDLTIMNDLEPWGQAWGDHLYSFLHSLCHQHHAWVTATDTCITSLTKWVLYPSSLCCLHTHTRARICTHTHTHTHMQTRTHTYTHPRASKLFTPYGLHTNNQHPNTHLHYPHTYTPFKRRQAPLPSYTQPICTRSSRWIPLAEA